MARPSKFSDSDKLECMTIICEKIATSSMSLRRILEDETLPSVSELYRWFNEPAIGERIRELYARAKSDQMDYLAEEMLEIADDARNDLMYTQFGEQENKEVVNRSKLRIDTRKWLACHLKPKVYGEKIEHAGEIKSTEGFSPEQFTQILNEIRSNNV